MLHICIKNGKISRSVFTTTNIKLGAFESCPLRLHLRRHHQYRRYGNCDIWKGRSAASIARSQHGDGCTFTSASPPAFQRTGYGSGYGYGNRRGLLTLAIETSCDDTCVAILEKRSSLDHVDDVDIDIDANINDKISGPDGDENAVATSTSISYPQPRAKLHFHEKITAKNTGLGGIHPLEALQSHRENLAKLITRSLILLPVVEYTSASTPSGTTTATPEAIDPRRTITGPDGLTRRKPDFITVTRGPGMRSNLSCGLDTAKGLSVAWQVPLLGVHHMQAHALTPRLVYVLGENDTSGKERGDENEEGKEKDEEGNKGTEVMVLKPAFPFLTLLVSGGHTMLLHSTELNTHKILATTADIAIGDALDKIGRLLLPDDLKANVTKDTAYAKHLSEYAFPTPDHFRYWNIPKRRADEIDRPTNEFGWQIHTPLAQTRDLGFSFSSIATRPEKIFMDGITAGTMSSEERLLLARTALGTAFEHLSSRIVIALEMLREDGINVPTLVVSGGVAANDFLRYVFRSILDVRGFGDVDLIFPPVALCTDNAAMIAWTGMEMYEAGFRSDLDICSIRKWSMDADSEDGGILGVGGWTQVAA